MDIITRQQLSTWLWLNEMVLVSVGRPALGGKQAKCINMMATTYTQVCIFVFNNS